jgi:hypothetical protein
MAQKPMRKRKRKRRTIPTGDNMTRLKSMGAVQTGAYAEAIQGVADNIVRSAIRNGLRTSPIISNGIEAGVYRIGVCRLYAADDLRISYAGPYRIRQSENAST